MKLKIYEKELDINEIKANRRVTKILEINPDHEIFKVLQKVYDKNKDMINQYADLLYQQALLIEGFPIEDPVDFSNKICQLMQQASQM